MIERLAVDCSEPFPGSPAEFGIFMRNEAAKWGAVVRGIGLHVDSGRDELHRNLEEVVSGE